MQHSNSVSLEREGDLARLTMKSLQRILMIVPLGKFLQRIHKRFLTYPATVCKE